MALHSPAMKVLSSLAGASSCTRMFLFLANQGGADQTLNSIQLRKQWEKTFDNVYIQPTIRNQVGKHTCCIF